MVTLAALLLSKHSASTPYYMIKVIPHSYVPINYMYNYDIYIIYSSFTAFVKLADLYVLDWAD